MSFLVLFFCPRTFWRWEEGEGKEKRPASSPPSLLLLSPPSLSPKVPRISRRTARREKLLPRVCLPPHLRKSGQYCIFLFEEGRARPTDLLGTLRFSFVLPSFSPTLLKKNTSRVKFCTTPTFMLTSRASWVLSDSEFRVDVVDFKDAFAVELSLVL